MWGSAHHAFQLGGELMILGGYNAMTAGDVLFGQDGRLVAITATFTIVIGL
jgi:hypothetical protein